MEGSIEPTPAPGKEDSQNRRGILVATNTTRTQVWTASNKWEDKDTVAARKAGLAWGEDSGLNWDEKYGAWLESLERTRATAGWYDTFTLTTPWGKSLPSPALECAEMAIFLRVTFAAWYQLPLFFEGWSTGNGRIYIGHNGVRTATGRLSNTPEFGVSYQDKTSLTPAQYAAAWPKDSALRARKLWDSEDVQSMVAPGATIGTYLDEIHLNKRAGHFTVFALNYLSSANIADTANTYNIVPEAIRAGDTLVERWQRNGIGHTLVVKEVTKIAEGNLDATMLSGSMPRRQGKWESGAASKQYFTSEYAGGAGINDAGDQYAKLGGGVKRWRVAKNIGGYWTNTWMDADEAHWINSTDYARIGARPERFESLLGEVSPEQTRAELLAQISDSRMHLQNFPASCSARERREKAFDELYDVSARAFREDKAAVDATHRKLADYVLAELDYTKSKTCCWNSSTANMYKIIEDFANAEKAAADALHMCAQPTVFMSQTDGYERWRAYAASTGREAEWMAWRADEACAQSGVPADTESNHDWTNYCELGATDSGATCTDTFEPNNLRAAARAMARGTSQNNLRICEGDVDFFTFPAGGTVTLSFRHTDGDIDMESLDSSGARTGSSTGSSDSETLTVATGAVIRVYGYNNATNTYSIRVD